VKVNNLIIETVYIDEIGKESDYIDADAESRLLD
jgi:hypothetical protein